MTNNRHPRLRTSFQKLPISDPRGRLHLPHGFGRWVKDPHYHRLGRIAEKPGTAFREYPFWRRHSDLFGLRGALMQQQAKGRMHGTTSRGKDGSGKAELNGQPSRTQMARLIARHGEQLDRGREYRTRSVWSR